MEHPRILFVDDEPGIRTTLPPILQMHGFDVISVATVADAISALNSQRFDILLADLNIGEPGDGFTVVSAMRRTQPEAVTIIITGYPAFETALEAIRKQVDYYLVKPTKVEELVEAIRERLKNRPVHHSIPLKRVAEILEDRKEEVISEWLSLVGEDPELASVPISDKERADHVPDVLSELLYVLRNHSGVKSDKALAAAAKHGVARRKQKYSIPMIVHESRLLRRVIFEAVQKNLLSVEISYLVPDMIQMSDRLDAEVKTCVEAYLSADP